MCKFSVGAGFHFISMYSFPIKSKAGLAAMAHVVLSLTTVGELHHLPPIQGDDHALDFSGAFLTIQEE